MACVGRAEAPDFFELLGVEQGCSFRDIKNAYVAKALQLHPDKQKPKVRQTRPFLFFWKGCIVAHLPPFLFAIDVLFVFNCVVVVVWGRAMMRLCPKGNPPPKRSNRPFKFNHL
jgi:hypothetical protein